MKVRCPRDVSNLEMSPLMTLYWTCETAESVSSIESSMETSPSWTRPSNLGPSHLYFWFNQSRTGRRISTVEVSIPFDTNSGDKFNGICNQSGKNSMAYVFVRFQIRTALNLLITFDLRTIMNVILDAYCQYCGSYMVSRSPR